MTALFEHTLLFRFSHRPCFLTLFGHSNRGKFVFNNSQGAPEVYALGFSYLGKLCRTFFLYCYEEDNGITAIKFSARVSSVPLGGESLQLVSSKTGGK
jgi:hypothetical protein